MASGHDTAHSIDLESEHGADAHAGHDDHALGHDDHGHGHGTHGDGGNAWVIPPLVVGLVIGLIIAVLMGTGSGASPFHHLFG